VTANHMVCQQTIAV